jgi:hypothetical protein
LPAAGTQSAPNCSWNAATIGTALAGSMLIAGADQLVPDRDPAEPGRSPDVKSQANVELPGGVPFISDADLQPHWQRQA